MKLVRYGLPVVFGKRYSMYRGVNLVLLHAPNVPTQNSSKERQLQNYQIFLTFLQPDIFENLIYQIMESYIIKTRELSSRHSSLGR